MNDEPLDSLEAELAGLRPQPIPPALRRRLAERLGAPRWTWRRWAITAAGAAAAGLAVVLAWPTPEPVAPRINSGLVSNNVKQKTVAPATLAEYRRAFEQSPTALDQMLSRHTTLSLREPGPELRAGHRFNEPLLDSLGER